LPAEAYAVSTHQAAVYARGVGARAIKLQRTSATPLVNGFRVGQVSLQERLQIYDKLREQLAAVARLETLIEGARKTEPLPITTVLPQLTPSYT
jgi:hypothetical protein